MMDQYDTLPNCQFCEMPEVECPHETGMARARPEERAEKETLLNSTATSVEVHLALSGGRRIIVDAIPFDGEPELDVEVTSERTFVTEPDIVDHPEPPMIYYGGTRLASLDGFTLSVGPHKSLRFYSPDKDGDDDD